MSDLDAVAFRILAAAGHMAASRGLVRPSLPSLDELAELARHHLATAAAPGAPPGTLSQAGTIVVSTLAARQYQEYERWAIDGVTDELSRVDVTKLLLNARALPKASDTDLWRVRARDLGIELVARVVADGRLRIVTGITVTDLRTATTIRP